MEKNNWVWYIVLWLIGILVGMAIMDTIHNVDTSNITKPDTTYNKVKLDSIQVKVGKHDTTIYKLKIKLKDDIERSYQLSDSDAIKLFKQLAVQSDTIK